MNNTTKAIIAIVVILVASFLLYRQLAGGPKNDIDSATKKELETQLDAITQAVRATIDPAIGKAASKGWDATSSSWAQGSYGRSKALLNKVFGKSFQASDIQNLSIYRDSDSPNQVAGFQYQGTDYAFVLAELPPGTGKFLIVEFRQE